MCLGVFCYTRSDDVALVRTEQGYENGVPRSIPSVLGTGWDIGVVLRSGRVVMSKGTAALCVTVSDVCGKKSWKDYARY